MTTNTKTTTAITQNPILAPSRIQEWWLPKAGNILATLFIVMAITKMPFTKALTYFFPSMLTILGIGAFGHMVNDWLDIKADHKAGKKNRMAKLPVYQRILVLFLFLTVALLPWWVLPFDENSLWLLGAEFVLLIIYAIPPFRLKERALWGALADGLYAYAVPAVLAAYTYFLIPGGSVDWLFLAILFAWQLFIGLHNILIHQVEDYENDLKAGSWTYPVAKGTKRATKFTIYGVLIPELLLFTSFVGYVSLVYFKGYFILPLVFLVLRYLPLLLVSSIRVFAHLDNAKDLQTVNMTYYKFLIFWNLWWCGMHSYGYMAVLGGALYFGVPQIKESVGGLVKKAYDRAYYFLGYWVNMSVYWFRVYIKGEDDKTARREHYNEEIHGKGKKRASIAVVNRNQSKYTETFVKQHLLHLPQDVHFFFGGDSYFPKYVTLKHKGGILQFLPNSFNKIKSFLLPSEYLLKIAFQHYLVESKTKLVLAEFGTVGAHVAPACKELGLPLIVIFYGYDGFHKNVLEQNKESYPVLFDYASAIIGVSEDMVQQLNKLGAPKEKLRYHPCSVDLSLFEYTDHSKNDPVFLAVGRFAESKSPHLTILAFHKVVQEIPSARLIMVGKEDGELFEACIILVKALKLEERVEFKGMLSHNEVYQIMKKAIAFVQHSVTTPIYGDKEGTPVAIMEAMASGLPVVSTRHAGIQEMIIHEESGLLVEEYDVDGMAREMIRVAKDGEFAKGLGISAKKRIHSHPLLANNIHILAELIEELLD